MIALSTPPTCRSSNLTVSAAVPDFGVPDLTRHRAEACILDEISQVRRHKNTDAKAAQRIESSLRYMIAHLNEPMRIATLSSMVGLSESCFFAHFKSATGLTPMQLLIRARMRWAGELLRQTDLQIKEIASLVGYHDQFYFSRLFKLVHGIAPQHYRERMETPVVGN